MVRFVKLLVNVLWPFFGLALLVLCFSPGCSSDGADPEENFPESSKKTSNPDGQPAARPESSLPSRAAALVNGDEITVAELQERLHQAMIEGNMESPPTEYTLNQLRNDVLEELMKERLIAQKAEKQGVTVSEEEFQQFVGRVREEYEGASIQDILAQQGKDYETWAEAQRKALLREKVISTSMGNFTSVTEAEVRQYYEKNIEKYDHPDQVRASQILTYDEETARQALQEIRDGAAFEQAARAYSESPDASKGGDLGFFARDVMPPEFDEVIFSLSMNEVSDVVKTPYGYQIFTLTGRREAQRVSFDEAKEQIRTLLKQKKRMVATDLWLTELRVNAKIELNHDVIQRVK